MVNPLDDRLAETTAGATRVAVLNGSLRAGSANAVALDAAVAALQERGAVDVRTVTGLDGIPPLRPDLVDDAPDAVVQFRATLDSTDALLLAAPEYAAGVAGVVKNALDWLVGSATLYHKPVAVFSAGTTGGPFAIEQLVRTLTWQGALVVARCSIAAPLTKMDASHKAFVDGETLAHIAIAAETLAEAVAATPKRKLELVAATVEAYGIDVARFGDLI